MTPKALIHLIMSQTTVLVAQLATSSGIRAPLGDIAGQVFLELSRAIEAQGVPRKVVADMFGLALRGYQKKVQRLEESQTETGTTLWEAVLKHVQTKGPLTRFAVEERFARDDYRSVAAVLNDLVGSGLLYRTGNGDTALYKSTDGAELAQLARAGHGEALRTMIWSLLYQEPGLSAAALVERLNASERAVEAALEALLEDQRIKSAENGGYVTETLVIPVGDEEGWAAAVFDHYQAVALAIGAKLRAQSLKARERDLVGGTTLTFDLNPEHPHREEVLGLLQRIREETDRVWNKVHTWNEGHPVQESEKSRVTFYFGQSINPLTEEPDA